MTQNYITIFGIVELVSFFIIIYLIIKANTFVNDIQQEVRELHLILPASIRDIRLDLRNLNRVLEKESGNKLFSSQKLGFVAGKLFTELFMLRLTTAQVNKKYVVLSIISKIFA